MWSNAERCQVIVQYTEQQPSDHAAELLSVAQEVVTVFACCCMQPYREALDSEPASEHEYISGRCLIGLYVPLLLNTGFGFANDSENIYVLREIAGQQPGIVVYTCIIISRSKRQEILKPVLDWAKSKQATAYGLTTESHQIKIRQ